MFLLLSHLLRRRFKFFRKYFIPSSLVAGFIVLLIGPQVLGAISENIAGPDNPVADGLIAEDFLDLWEEVPGLLITVVFAALFLGKKIPSVKKIWEVSGAQVAFGQSIAWGQYVVGILLAMLILVPYFDQEPAIGALIEIGFEGGHGTVAGLEDAFEEFDLDDGRDIGMAMATLGVIFSIIVGVMIINWGAKKGEGKALDESAEDEKPEEKSIAPEALGEQYDRASDSFMIHLGVVGFAIAIGWLIQQLLIWIEETTWLAAGGPELMTHFPLFPLAMVGGIIIQRLVDHLGKEELLSPVIMRHISGSALDLIIIAAVGTLALDVIAENWAVIAILASGGLVWCLAAFFLLAPRIFRRNKFERSLGDIVQSLAMTVMGLLMLKTVDPEDESKALEGFKYKQLLFEPVVGGGLFTAASVPLIAQVGPWPTLAIVGVLTIGWIFVGIKYVAPMDEKAAEED